MIQLVYGDDRVKAQQAIIKALGAGYETIEADGLTRGDMDSIFHGVSIFGDHRSILLKGLNENKECWDVLPNYLKTDHNVVLWNSALDKRSTVYKELIQQKISIKEYKLAEDTDQKLVFDIMDTAVRGNIKTALNMCEKIEDTNDPFRFMGLMVSQALRKLTLRQAKAAKILKILARADLDMKSSTVEPWLIVKTALMEIANQ